MMITNHSSIIYSQIFSRLLNSAISDFSLSFVATSISSASTPLISFQKKILLCVRSLLNETPPPPNNYENEKILFLKWSMNYWTDAIEIVPAVLI